MNLTFVFDGYMAQTALESSFQLFVFDGYLIYGEVPPIIEIPDGAAGQAGEEEGIRRRREQDDRDWLDILYIFMKVKQS